MKRIQDPDLIQNRSFLHTLKTNEWECSLEQLYNKLPAVALAPGSFSSGHQTVNIHWPSLISRCTFKLVCVASVPTGLLTFFKRQTETRCCLSSGMLIAVHQFKTKGHVQKPWQIENAWSTSRPESVWETGPSPISASVSLLPPLLPPPVSPLSSSTPASSSSCRTRRWIWNRCIVVWTVFWTRTWPTSRSPAPLSRSLRWTSAACSPARPLWCRGRSPCGTTRPRASLWPPSSQGRGCRLRLYPTLTMGGP